MDDHIKKELAGLSHLGDDEFLDGFCLILEYRGKSDLARRVRNAYYRLETDPVYSKESGQVSRAQSSFTGSPYDESGQSSLFDRRTGDLPAGRSVPDDEVDDFDDLYKFAGG